MFQVRILSRNKGRGKRHSICAEKATSLMNQQMKRQIGEVSFRRQTCSRAHHLSQIRLLAPQIVRYLPRFTDNQTILNQNSNIWSSMIRIDTAIAELKGRKAPEVVKRVIGIIWSIWIRQSIQLWKRKDSKRKKHGRESLNKC